MDGKPLVDNGGLHGNREQCAARDLAAGLHTVKVNWFQAYGGENLMVYYRSITFYIIMCIRRRGWVWYVMPLVFTAVLILEERKFFYPALSNGHQHSPLLQSGG